MNLIEDALKLALEVHRGQRDLGGAPYILHPLRVMHAMRSEVEKAVAVLHDVLEDSKDPDISFKVIGLFAEYLPPDDAADAFDAVQALTRREGESYREFIARAGKNPLARAVKMADLVDNMDLSRLPEVGEREEQRVRRYKKAYAYLYELSA